MNLRRRDSIKMHKGFGQITRKYLGKSFDECNCLQLLYNIYKKMGVEVLDSYNGHDLKTYVKYWEENPEQATKDMISLFQNYGKEVDTRFLKRGDAVIVEYKDIKFPAVYVGDNNIMSVSKEVGVRMVALGRLIQPIMARRLV
jgi:hypothetical protein